jgi:hypothetical protein
VQVNYPSISMVGVAVDLRHSRRYRVSATASFLWERADGLLEETSGAIRDISDRGVFIVTDTVPPVGAHLDVDVHLPSVEAGSAAVQLHGEGVVVRIETRAGEGRGFAAAMVFQTEIASGRPVIDPKKIH